jgi:hypothetical protein
MDREDVKVPPIKRKALASDVAGKVIGDESVAGEGKIAKARALRAAPRTTCTKTRRSEGMTTFRRVAAAL